MTISTLRYLNLRTYKYTKLQKEELLRTALSCVEHNEVLEIHSHGSVIGYHEKTGEGLTCITFKDRPNHLVSQVTKHAARNDGATLRNERLKFYIDGRYIDGVRIVRQVMHLLHHLTAFTPAIDELVLWSNDIPIQLLSVLEDEHRRFTVDVTPRVGFTLAIDPTFQTNTMLLQSMS